MCRIVDTDLSSCLLCQTSQDRKCKHELAVCNNQAVHPGWTSYYYKNSGGLSTFQGCGFCKYAQKSNLKTPAYSLTENPGWPGCCTPPTDRYFSWIPPQDWPFVAQYHVMPIPATVRSALDNLQALKNKNGKPREKPTIATDSLVHNRATQQQPVPIPRESGYYARSHSPSAIYLSGSDQSPPRSPPSSKDSNSSGSPPSSTVSRRREFDGSERSSPVSPIRSSSQDDHRGIRSSSSLGSRRTDSPVERDRDPLTGKRRSNSDPKQQQQYPLVNGRQRDMAQPLRGESPSRSREKESPTQTKFKPSPGSTVSSHHPYSTPLSGASSSMKKLSSVEPSSPPRQTMPPAQIRARQNNDPPITSILANMSLGGPNGVSLAGPASATLARIQMENGTKRGVIPPHVRKAGSVISATSSSSSSTNSSAREGTVVSDGFTDYLSDDSDFDLQRQAEIEAENAYQEALRKHEEMEFRQARDSLAGLSRRPIVPPAGGRSRLRA